jgi:hypothetical protein
MATELSPSPCLSVSLKTPPHHTFNVRNSKKATRKPSSETKQVETVIWVPISRSVRNTCCLKPLDLNYSVMAAREN